MKAANDGPAEAAVRGLDRKTQVEVKADFGTLVLKRIPEWGRISWSLHQLGTSGEPLKKQITGSKSVCSFNYSYTPNECFANIKRQENLCVLIE